MMTSITPIMPMTPTRRTARPGRPLARRWISIACLLVGAAAFVPAPRPALGQDHPPGTTLTPELRRAIVDSLGVAFDQSYVFPEVGRKMQSAMRDHLRRGAYDGISSLPLFTERLTSDLLAVSHDKHIGVFVVPPPDPGQPVPDEAEIRRARAEEAGRRNHGFQRVERLAGNVGYLDLRSFDEAGFGEAGSVAVAAMNFLGRSDALIFDLRRNGGGSPSMIQLITSYLFDEPTHLNSFYVREGDKTNQFWTQASVPGRRLSEVPVFVLTSGYTFSGAEEFSYNLQTRKRGTIVGEVTGGGAHPVAGHVFPTLGVGARIPFGRAVNPITNTNWEGVGVQPDIACPAETALETAHLEALRILREQEDDPIRRGELDWAITGLEAARGGHRAAPADLAGCAGAYGPRRISAEGSELFYQREGRPRFRLVPMAPDLFSLEGLDNFRLRFGRDSAGRVDRLVGLYEDGRQDESPRTGDGE